MFFIIFGILMIYYHFSIVLWGKGCNMYVGHLAHSSSRFAFRPLPPRARTLKAGSHPNKKSTVVLINKRETGLEPAAFCLGSKHSTTELLPQFIFKF